MAAYGPPGAAAGGCCGGTFSGTIQGCITGLAGTTVDFQQSGVSQITLTTDASGHFSAVIPAGTYDVIITAISSRFAVRTIPGLVITGSTATLLTQKLAGATGFHCSARCQIPLADVFDMTDTDTGGTNHPMTWTSGGSAGGWQSVGYNSSSGLGLKATLDANSGTFSIGLSSGVLTAGNNCTPPITFTFTSGTRQWVVTNA